MSSGGYGPVFRQFERLLKGGGTASGLGEGQLLRRFAADRDEAAFEALVTRHGPMVLGTCRRMLADPHDVDDAFQATFLVLARKASSIRDGDRLGPWLHGVARRVATRSRVQTARRNAREKAGAEDQAVADGHSVEILELRSALDEELARLPEKYRAPLVLCYLEGLTHDEAAQQLSWPVGTVRSRLAGGRDRLRSRLTRRGLAPSDTVPALVIPEGLMSSTIRIATIAGSAPAHVVNLAKGAMVAMIWHKLKGLAALGLMAGLTVGGAGAMAQLGGVGSGPAQVPGKSPDGKTLKLSEAEVLEQREMEEQLKARRLSEEEIKYRLATMDIETEIQTQRFYGQPLDRNWVRTRLGEIDANIEKLERQLTVMAESKQKLLDRIEGKAEKVGPKPDESRPPAPIASSVADPFKPVPAPASNRQPGGLGGSAQPTILNLDGDPICFLIIPSEKDRMTILNAETQERQIHPLPKGLTQVLPVITQYLMGFSMDGPEIKGLEVYDRLEKKWQHQDLREPATSVSPIVGMSTVTYRVGRILYIYSGPAKKWAVLELKYPGAGRRGSMEQNYSSDPNKIMYRDGSAFHLYDVRVGEWKQLDIRDLK